MSRNAIHLISFIVCLSLILSNAAQAELVGWWEFNEGSGTEALDSSGNDNTGTFHDSVGWSDGKIGFAVEFDGTAGYVLIPNPGVLTLINQGDFTITMWFRQHTIGTTINLLQQTDLNGTGRTLLLSDPTNGIRSYLGGQTTVSGVIAEAETWYHVAMVVTEEGATDTIHFYINGEAAGTPAATPSEDCTGDYLIATNKTLDGRWIDGLVDDLRLYNHALTETEVLAAMEGTGGGYPFVRSPDPADGTLISDTWVNLTWSPGDFAVSHDVYLGDNFEDVDNGTGDAFRGNQTSTLFLAGFPGFAYPDGLVPGTTYYWRIDEVNEADPNSPWKGPIWSFSVPPKTAYNPNPADGAESIGPDSVTLSWTPGFGAILHTVYFGDDFNQVDHAAGGAPLGAATYNPGTLELEKVYYWRVDEFDAVETHKGDTWFFATPGAVGNPKPAYDATDVQLNAILSWTPADSAASHQLYFGTDEETVRNADTGSPAYIGSKSLGAETYDPGLLEAGKAYYWRVDEVDGQGNVAKGPLWIFTTGDFLLVDDFEGYTDDDPNNEAIWQSWIDGYGTTDNGAQVGYLLPPYAEQSVVHSGLQSMPLLYVNEGAVTNSEATLTLTALRDWTQAGVSDLSLWFRGAGANAAEPLYVALSNSTGAPGVVAHDDAEAAQTSRWTQWAIPLQAFADQGINLTNVDKIAIGLGTKAGGAVAGGSGTIYVDDIRLN
ncbi:MAG: LamG domain-containing protein [Sedimentisphaerales bacterium]|nr:LamG domain-containing protein [Sedimentisphaerales bacterium]